MLPRQIQVLLANPITLAGAAVLAVALVAYIIAGIIRRRQEYRELAPNEPPPLLIPVQRRGGPAPLFSSRLPREGPTNPAGPGASDLAAAAMAPTGTPSGSGSRFAGPQRNGVTGTSGGGPTSNPPGMPGAAPGMPGAMPGVMGHDVQVAAPAAARSNGSASKVVHTLPPMDGTLQFLPGRLEVVDGESPGRDIRFVRTWGEIPEITFGRVTGPPYRHIQLRSQTVSRQHARMQYTDGRWQLTNLSQTNPVVINGLALDSAHGQRTLREGDQIEMGEVVFRFRER